MPGRSQNAPSPGFRLPRPFRQPFEALRRELPEAQRAVFDVLALAGRLGHEPPNRPSNLALFAGSRDPRRRLRRHLARHASARPSPHWRAAAMRLTDRLVAIFERHHGEPTHRTLLALMNNASIALAPDCRVPTHPALNAAWRAQLSLFARLYGTGIARLGRLAWIDSRTLTRLRREARARARLAPTLRAPRPGPISRQLAVDSRLMRAVSRALGRRSTPGYEARYLVYRRAGDYFWPHPDDPEYAVNVLVCLDRQLPKGRTSGSAFLAYSADGSIERYELEPGEALAVEARGLVHAREPLARGERLTLLSIAVQ